MTPLALRTWLRYLVPLTVLAVLAFVPFLYLALTAKTATTVPDARMQVRYAWALAGAALAFHLWLVAGVAPAVRAVASGAPLSQIAAFVAGLRGLVRGALPWLVTVAAIVLGGVALVIPGVLVAILVSLTGASDQTSPQAAIADSAAVVRPRLPTIALIVAAIVVVDLAITFVFQLQYVPAITKKATAAQLAPIRMLVRHSALAIVAIAPLFACALAAAYSHAKRR